MARPAVARWGSSDAFWIARLARGAKPVFVLAESAQDAERLSDLGAAGVIGKPFDPMTLAARVKAFLR